MNLKKLLASVLSTICLFLCGILTPVTEIVASAAGANIKSEFVYSLSELQDILGEDSALTFIPLNKTAEGKDDQSELALVLQIHLENGLSDLTDSLTKEVLAPALFHLTQNNRQLGLGDPPQMIIDRDRDIFDLQPIFDLFTDRVDDLLQAVNENVENGVAKKSFDMSGYAPANPSQSAKADSMGFDFAKTSLIYTGTNPKQSAISIDFYLTVDGTQKALSSLESIASSFKNYITLDSLKYTYKHNAAIFDTGEISGDLTMKATVDYTKSPQSVATFAACIAYVTEDEEIKTELVNGINVYLAKQTVGQLEATFDEVTSQDALTAIKRFNEVPFEEMLSSLGIDSEKMATAADDFGDMARMIGDISTSLSLNATVGKFADHKTNDGKYLFSLLSADGTGSTTDAEITIDLFTDETDLTALTALIAEIEALNPDDYTADSWAKVKTWLESAKRCTVKSDQTSVNLVLANLALAQRNLKKITPSSVQEQPDLLWLYITMPIVFVLILGGVAAYFFLYQRQRFTDDTPIVRYEIGDDDPAPSEATPDEEQAADETPEEEDTALPEENEERAEESNESEEQTESEADEADKADENE